ncbi:MAG: IS1634 family transposase [Spirochaetota bacterium]|nr:IS1634 family transposase [Spirochaetota bacterium]
MDQARKEENRTIEISISPHTVLALGTDTRKNFGHVAFSHLYHELELDYFINNRRRYTDARYNHNAIFKMLVYSRLLAPGSKKRSFEKRTMLFDKMDFSLDDVYRSLSFFAQFKDPMLLALHKRIKKLYGRDTSLVYYDVTNYYFEISTQDELRKKGVSKEHRPDPIVQMGLFMDTDGIPLTYGLYPGNMLDKQTLIPMIHQVRKKYELGRFIVVGDRGMISGDNIRRILIDNCGYVLSYSIRAADAAFKEYVLDQSEYREIGREGFKIKSRTYPREIYVSTLKGKKKKVSIDEKHIVFYSPDYDRKAKADRQAVLAKAQKLISSPAAYARATSYGAAKYVKNLTFSPSAGHLIDDAEHFLTADRETLAEEEKYDGYYAIVTSELDMEDEKIVEIYRGLWKIEDSFRITKSELETRPVYVSRRDHIEAHFLICFVALVLARLLDKRLDGRHSVPKILESLRRCSCSLMEENLYLFDYYDQVLSDIGQAVGIDFSRKYRTTGEIKKIFGSSKKKDL